MSTADSLIYSLTREREALLGTIAWLSDTALDQQGAVGEWSIKDVLAHLTARERHIVSALPASLDAAGAPSVSDSSYVPPDSVAARRRRRERGVSPTEQVLELERARADLLCLLAHLGDSGLEWRPPWAGWHGTLADYVRVMVGDHEREHHAAIRSAVAQLASADEYLPGVRLSRELALASTGNP
jgi:DinB family protein